MSSSVCCRNFPSVANVVRRQEEQKEKLDRGEVLYAPKKKFEKKSNQSNCAVTEDTNDNWLMIFLIDEEKNHPRGKERSHNNVSDKSSQLKRPADIKKESKPPIQECFVSAPDSRSNSLKVWSFDFSLTCTSRFRPNGESLEWWGNRFWWR